MRKNIMWRDRQRHGNGVRREENIIWWSCQYFHHIVVLPIWALNLIIEKGEIMEMIKRGERIFSPLDLAMKHNGWLLWLYFWFNLDFSLIFVPWRMYHNYRFMLKLPLIDTIVGVNQGDPYLSSCLTAHRYRIIVSTILRRYTPRAIIFVIVCTLWVLVFERCVFVYSTRAHRYWTIVSSISSRYICMAV